MSRVIRSTSRPYDRSHAMQWLADRSCWPGDRPDFTDETPAGRATVIDLLRKVCTAMRGAGVRGAWHYSLPLHTELVRILKAEEAHLSALRDFAAQRGTRSSPAHTDRRRRRAA
jgi:hypothetical protein